MGLPQFSEIFNGLCFTLVPVITVSMLCLSHRIQYDLEHEQLRHLCENVA